MACRRYQGGGQGTGESVGQHRRARGRVPHLQQPEPARELPRLYRLICRTQPGDQSGSTVACHGGLAT